MSAYTSRKTIGPAIDVAAIGSIDAVLLSDDHHFDNLDHLGRERLASAKLVLTTEAGATRSGKQCERPGCVGTPKHQRTEWHAAPRDGDSRMPWPRRRRSRTCDRLRAHTRGFSGRRVRSGDTVW